jgi:heme/copper-type cytochrome/quinol oxidase subunit 2
MEVRVIRALILIVLTLVVLVGLFVLLRPNQSAVGPQTREFDLEIRGDSMEPSEVTVAEGDRVVLRITSASPVEVHVHGYDVETEVEPSAPAELSFKAKLTGRFEIEDHETEEELGTLVVEPR